MQKYPKTTATPTAIRNCMCAWWFSGVPRMAPRNFHAPIAAETANRPKNTPVNSSHRTLPALVNGPHTASPKRFFPLLESGLLLLHLSLRLSSLLPELHASGRSPRLHLRRCRPGARSARWVGRCSGIHCSHYRLRRQPSSDSQHSSEPHRIHKASVARHACPSKIRLWHPALAGTHPSGAPVHQTRDCSKHMLPYGITETAKQN